MDGGGEISDLCARFLAAQLVGDRREALRLVIEEGLERGVDVPTLHLQVIEPAQRAIGELWQENRIGVAEEHLATAVAQVCLARLYGHLPRGESVGRVAVVACVEGEQHDLGAKMVADFLEMHGLAVRYLGADVPAASLAACARAARADLVALSVTLAQHLPAAEREVAALAEALPGVRLALGGRALDDDPSLAARLPGVLVARNANAFVEVLRGAGLLAPRGAR